MSLPSAGNLNEQESKISALERANFDLKMQLFYLNQKQLDTSVLVDSSKEKEDEELDDSYELVQLREEQEYSRRRLIELESEILQLQITRDNNIENATKIKPFDLMVLEENRRREREASLAIAEHDASVIKKLQLDIASIQHQHNSDKMNDCTEKLAIQLELVANKDLMINELSEDLRDLKQTVTSLALINSKNDRTTDDQNFTNKSIHGDSFVPPNGNNQRNRGAHNGGIAEKYYREEIDTLRSENSVLKDQLEKQRVAIRNQEEALLRLNKSTGDISALETEELSRLGAELDKCIGEKEQLQTKCRKLEEMVVAIRKEHKKELELRGIEVDSAVDSSHHKKLQLKQQQQQENQHLRSEDQLQTIEMYRQREEELLLALEGVVQRCQELEAQLHH